jgi:hypothetical protein
LSQRSHVLLCCVRACVHRASRVSCVTTSAHLNMNLTR